MLDDDTQSDPKICSANKIVLGHISNLSVEKGLDLVITTFASIKAAGFDVALILAGPTNSNNEEILVKEALKKYPDSINCRGPVHGSNKKEFFNDIHIMLFPSRNEAQPLVVLEALSYGVPVICFKRGCIENIVDSKCGMLVMQDANFIKLASSYIIKCLKDTDLYREYSRSAIVRAIKIKSKALEELEEVIALIGKK
ncbi:MAG: glycosyltransferase family 4 protein [Desulfobulbaceae bacterium]|nr:glycosyltransferase family 4 protein [Desulfobulbaceae bacterium]